MSLEPDYGDAIDLEDVALDFIHEEGLRAFDHGPPLVDLLRETREKAFDAGFKQARALAAAEVRRAESDGDVDAEAKERIARRIESLSTPTEPRPICDTPGCGGEIPKGGEGHPEICPRCLKSDEARQ